MGILYSHQEKDPKFTASVQSYLKTLEMERWSAEELKHRVQENIDDEIDYVISPALGGLLVGYELARSLGSKFIFYES